MKIGREQAPHYTWGENCDGWHLVRTPGLSVIQERMPPGTAEIPHYHREAAQFFFVLRGRLTFEVEGAVHELGPEEGIEIGAGSVHRVENRGGEAAEFLVISMPPSHGDRVPVDPVGRDLS